MNAVCLPNRLKRRSGCRHGRHGNLFNTRTRTQTRLSY